MLPEETNMPSKRRTNRPQKSLGTPASSALANANGARPKTKLRKSAAVVRSKIKSTTSNSNMLQQQQQTNEVVDDEIDTSNNNAEGNDSLAVNNNTTSGYGNNGGMMGGGMGMGMSPYGMGGMGGMMGMGGMGMMGMGGMGMGMGGMYGMGGMGGMMGSHYLMSLNQMLFGFQSLIFSLGQAVQIVGMNAQQLRHVYESIRGMVENALGQVGKLGSISSLEEVIGIKIKGDGAKRWILGDDAANRNRTDHDRETAGDDGRGEPVLTQSEIIRRRRLAAFRWTMTLSASYFMYRAVRRMLRALIYGGARGGNHRNMSIQQQQQQQQPGNYYGGGGGRMTSPYNQQYGNGMGGQYGSGSYGMNSRYGGGGGMSGYGRGQYDTHSQGYGDNNMGGSYY